MWCNMIYIFHPVNSIPIVFILLQDGGYNWILVRTKSGTYLQLGRGLVGLKQAMSHLLVPMSNNLRKFLSCVIRRGPNSVNLPPTNQILIYSEIWCQGEYNRYPVWIIWFNIYYSMGYIWPDAIGVHHVPN